MNRNEIKREIEKLLEIQERTYGTKVAEELKEFAATCSDSMVYIGGDNGGPPVASKEVYVHDLADGYITRPYDRFYRFYDNMVIVSSKHQGMKILAGDTLRLNSRTTKIFVKEGSEWKMAYFTYAPLPIVYFKTTMANPRALTDYIGAYEIEPGVIDSITVLDGRLYSNVAGGGKEEMKALNDSTFIGDGYFGKVFFPRDKSGKVTHYTFEWTDGQRINFPRVR
ncbi:MAG TPA: nuclear transport factor 2 family protein [Cyclobacteriaceae bacterium]|nr:nuclear transport factor 2 family protein [Cyclobacteriaceae bacterium]